MVRDGFRPQRHRVDAGGALFGLTSYYEGMQPWWRVSAAEVILTVIIVVGVGILALALATDNSQDDRHRYNGTSIEAPGQSP